MQVKEEAAAKAKAEAERLEAEKKKAAEEAAKMQRKQEKLKQEMAQKSQDAEQVSGAAAAEGGRQQQRLLDGVVLGSSGLGNSTVCVEGREVRLWPWHAVWGDGCSCLASWHRRLGAAMSSCDSLWRTRLCSAYTWRHVSAA